MEFAYACVAPLQPACSLRAACVACVATALRAALHLRATCVACVHLRGTCVACVALAWRHLRATCVACVAPARRFSSHLRPTGVAPRGKTQKIFLSVWNNEIVKAAENAQKNRKIIVVHTWGFCGLHRLHFVPKRLGGFAFVPQKSSSTQIQQSRGLIFHPKSPPQKRVAMAHSSFRKVENKHRRHKTPQVRCFFWFGGSLHCFFGNCFLKGRRLVAFPTLKLAGLIARVGIRGEGTVIGVFANSGRHEKIIGRPKNRHWCKNSGDQNAYLLLIITDSRSPSMIH